jgi:hypothetical protein
MTQFLPTAERPEGHRLEEVLTIIRNELVRRMPKIVDDARPEAQTVLANDVKILALLEEAIALAHDSSRLLKRSFGEHVEGRPRIGVA